MERLLGTKVHSRDKIVHVWERDDYYAKGRQPCTIIMQPFTEADNRLSMIVYMRNNDMINIFPSDIFIHSTYLKYWAIKRKLEYGNIYWVSAIAYYQKKRDKLKFTKRLLEEWKHNYYIAQIKPTHWDRDILDDLELKERYEAKLRGEEIDLEYGPALSDFRTDYVREWCKIMTLYHYRASKLKDQFEELSRSAWHTEFGLIKDSILPPR
jgi:thymidylate synthase